MSKPQRRPYDEFQRRSAEEMRTQSSRLLELMQTRRTVREFSSEPVERLVVDDCLRIAASAPSGANLQPWTFVVVESPEKRREVREAAEAEERAFYGGRAPGEWLHAVAPFGTDEHKRFLQTAPVLIAIFSRTWLEQPDGGRQKTYYAAESVGIATGFLISALHQSGLATLTHTPSPMKFLNAILGRPANERPFLLLVAGFPAADCEVPEITRRPFEDVVVRV